MGITAERMGELRQERAELAVVIADLTQAVHDLIAYLKRRDTQEANRRALQSIPR